MLKAFQIRIVIQSVSRIGVSRRMQKTDLVVILQSAYTHPGELTYFMYRHHVFVLHLAWWLYYKL